MAELTLAEVKAYCKVTDTEDDTLIEALWNAAVDYLDEAGVPSELADTPRYNLAVEALTLHWYDLRGGAVTGVQVTEIPLGLGPIIKQLQNYVPPEAEEDPTTEETTTT